jgi:hypothetical protein
MQREIAAGAGKLTAKMMRSHPECEFVVALVATPGDLTQWMFLRDLPHLRELIRLTIRTAGAHGQSVQVKPRVTDEVQQEIVAVIDDAKRLGARFSASQPAQA